MQQPQQPYQPYPNQQQQLPLYEQNTAQPTTVVIQQGSMHANGMMIPSSVSCQTCHKTGVTRMEKNTCNIHSWLWCLCGGCWCCFIPGCCNNQTQFKHYCSSCGAQVGVKESQCC